MDPHNIWKRIRGPFYVVQCMPSHSHKWECYDYNRAGCLLCGYKHECCDNLSFNKTCEIQEQEDGSHCCTITGLSIGSISIATNEYFENCIFEKKNTNLIYKGWDTVYEQVTFIIRDFLFNKKMILCKQKEISKKIAKIHNHVIAVVKQCKLTAPEQYPNILHILADIFHHIHLPYSILPTDEIALFCIQHITKCMFDMGFTNSVDNKTNLVIGLLYLMKSGLCINNNYWLPKYNILNHCLPHENSLEKHFHLSIKIICETENEIKLFLRQRSQLL